MRLLVFSLALMCETSSFAQSSWTTWTKYPNNPVYVHNTGGGWNVASDPAVIKDSATYVMVVSGDGGTSAGSPDGNSLLMATSPDGFVWTTLPNNQNGVVLTSAVGDWDESMEMPEYMHVGSEYQMFYTGYDPLVRDSSGGLVWGDLGLAISTNGTQFTKIGAPVLLRTPNWYDQDGITDPTIVASHDTLYMIYVGWCTQSCVMNNGFPAFYTMKAISLDTGRTWTKQGLLEPTGLIGLQHPDLVYDADGTYSLFCGEDQMCANTFVGLRHYTGASPFGPFTLVNTNPIFCMGTQAFEHAGTDGGFPSVLNDNGRARLYYTGVDEVNFYFEIGLVESNTVIGVEEQNAETNLMVYPNPTHDFLTLYGNTTTPTHVYVYNALGELILENNLNANAQLDVRNLSAGIYFLRIDEQHPIRFVKD